MLGHSLYPQKNPFATASTRPHGRSPMSDLIPLPLIPRPRTRHDCANVPRPCPFVSCRHHLYLDVSRSGVMKPNYPELEPDELPKEQSCALDIADSGPQKLETIARVLRVSKERARQIEEEIFKKLGGERSLKKLWRGLDGEVGRKPRAVTASPTDATDDISIDVEIGDGLLDGLEWAEGGIDLG